MNDKQMILAARILILIVGWILFVIFWPDTTRDRTPPPEKTAVREAVQYALIYSQRHDDFLPGSLPPKDLREMERFPADVDPELIEYLIDDGTRVQDLGSDSPVASIRVTGGRYVGFSGGYVLFETDQPGAVGNEGHHVAD